MLYANIGSEFDNWFMASFAIAFDVGRTHIACHILATRNDCWYNADGLTCCNNQLEYFGTHSASHQCIQLHIYLTGWTHRPSRFAIQLWWIRHSHRMAVSGVAWYTPNSSRFNAHCPYWPGQRPHGTPSRRVFVRIYSGTHPLLKLVIIRERGGCDANVSNANIRNRMGYTPDPQSVLWMAEWIHVRNLGRRLFDCLYCMLMNVRLHVHIRCSGRFRFGGGRMRTQAYMHTSEHYPCWHTIRMRLYVEWSTFRPPTYVQHDHTHTSIHTTFSRRFQFARIPILFMCGCVRIHTRTWIIQLPCTFRSNYLRLAVIYWIGTCVCVCVWIDCHPHRIAGRTTHCELFVPCCGFEHILWNRLRLEITEHGQSSTGSFGMSSASLSFATNRPKLWNNLVLECEPYPAEFSWSWKRMWNINYFHKISYVSSNQNHGKLNPPTIVTELIPKQFF